jgi:hypothetical protein
MAGEEGYAFSLTTFSPSGKLLQIEHALKAVQGGKASLGIQGACPARAGQGGLRRGACRAALLPHWLGARRAATATCPRPRLTLLPLAPHTHPVPRTRARAALQPRTA